MEQVELLQAPHFRCDFSLSEVPPSDHVLGVSDPAHLRKHLDVVLTEVNVVDKPLASEVLWDPPDEI